MTRHLIKALINALPRFAEEEGDFYIVSRDNLIAELSETQGVSAEIAGNTAALCEALLDSLATLKADDLQRGQWRFVSFPAQLLAMSVLTAMSDPESRYFETDFWNTRDVDSSQKERQREVLKVAENRRNDRHLTHNAVPVRFIHVAWSLIKLEGKVLFYHREDKTRHEDKSGNYGLPGGRVNQKDLGHLDGDMTEKLRILQSADCERIKPALAETLKRELLDEVGLVYEQHYFFKPWRALKPYRQVEGTKSNHALTEFYMNLFTIDLTLEGFCFLHQKIAEDDGLVWFSLDEVAKGRRWDGKTAYIEALYKDFDDDRESMKQALEGLGDSFKAGFINCQENYRIVLPRDEGQQVCAGVSGKEKPIGLTLAKHQLSLLLGLAAHLRGLDFVDQDAAMTLHPYGWLEVDDGELQFELVKLAEVFKDVEVIVIENRKDRWFRLSVSPDRAFFDDAYFCCSYDRKKLQSGKGKLQVTVLRRTFNTRLGKVGEQKKKSEISCQLARLLFGQNPDKSAWDRYRHSSLHSDVLSLGMRGLLRQDVGEIKTCCELVAW